MGKETAQTAPTRLHDIGGQEQRRFDSLLGPQANNISRAANRRARLDPRFVLSRGGGDGRARLDPRSVLSAGRGPAHFVQPLATDSKILKHYHIFFYLGGPPGHPGPQAVACLACSKLRLWPGAAVE